MSRLLRKVASRFRGDKTTADVSSYAERYRNASQSTRGRQADVLETQSGGEDDGATHQAERRYPQSRLKTWRNKLRRTTRANNDKVPGNRWMRPMSRRHLDGAIRSTRLLSGASSEATPSPPKSPPSIPEVLSIHVNADTAPPTFSESTAEADPDFGVAMGRMESNSGLHQMPPRLYLDMARRSNTFSPFRPFSPSVLHQSHDSLPTEPLSLPPRNFSASSFNTYRNFSSSLPSEAVPAPTPTPRFYSKSNLTALSLSRAPTADSGLSPVIMRSRIGSSGSVGHNTLVSFRSSNTPRSLSVEILSLSSRKASLPSTLASRNTTPSFSLASPTSFC